MILHLRRAAAAAILACVSASTLAVTATFPWATDPQADESATGAHSDYYRRAYSASSAPTAMGPPGAIEPLSTKEQYYIDVARTAASGAHIVDNVTAFVRRYDLARARVLDVGAGSGLLQDVVDDYTGLDIAPTARRFFHKRFVEASATSMPFPPASFDAVWSVWVLEHIPNPERALMEMRRVVRSGGYIYLWPAYDVDRYAAQGYRVRPYSDFGLAGRLKKATVPIAGATLFHYLYVPEIRALRFLASGLGSWPSRFRFTRLTPNYDQYWVADSDATTSFTQFELQLWFASRGDRVLERPPLARMLFSRYPVGPLIVQVRK